MTNIIYLTTWKVERERKRAQKAWTPMCKLDYSKWRVVDNRAKKENVVQFGDKEKKDEK